MGVDMERVKELVSTLVARGLGLYGREKMARICYDSGVALMDDDTTDWLDDDVEAALHRFLVNYAKFNVAAKMTVLVLAKKFGVPVPEELRRKKRRLSRLRRLLSRGRDN